jgi:hypothetical protein
LSSMSLRTPLRLRPVMPSKRTRSPLIRGTFRGIGVLRPQACPPD